MKLLLGILVLIACMSWTLPAGTTLASQNPTVPEGPADPAEVEAFMDGFWNQYMQPLDIPGAVFILVKDDQVLFAKGYGLADIAQDKPVDPGETLFAIGSVSKAVTATAVMQLVERGQLDLDEPVNAYLKSFQIDKSCSAPVTTAHLLTHSAGLDERVIGAFVSSADQLVPLAEYVARDLPPCIRPPGQEMSYCNHCYSLAGLLVQEIAGRPFETYIEEQIFSPLEMQHSSFHQPLPPGLDELRATGYIFAPGIQPAPLVYGNFFPSGAMWASGEDMGRFIIAHLQGDLAGKQKILQADTLAQMHARQFSQDPRLEGWTYGFFEHIENGQRMIGKDGDSPGFSSSLYLMPEHNLGFFLSYNATVSSSAGVIDPRLVFPSYFLDHYFPASEALLPAKPSGEAIELNGVYRLSRYSHTTIDKAISPMSILQWRVAANPDGSITLAYPSLLGGQTSHWVEVGPGLFQNQANSGYLTYRQDGRGRVSHIYTKITEEGVLERVAWYETLAFQASLLVFMLLVFLITPLTLLIVSIRKRRSAARARQPDETESPPAGRLLRLAPWLAGILCGLNLLFLAGLAMVVSQSMTTRAPVVPPWFIGMLVIPLATGVLALLMLAVASLAWKNRYGSFIGRTGYTLVALAGLAFTWFAWYWNLLGFKL